MNKDIIEFRDVHKKFGNRVILDGLSMTIREGETFVIIGRSGIGKSVTLKHMVGLLKADKGEVRVFGEDMGSLGRKGIESIRSRFGYLFQDGALLKSLTVEENVALPLKEHSDLNHSKILDVVHEKLALVSMAHAAGNMPDEISGGMRKRAGLARAIVRNPEVILYDEPTSGLDPVMSSQINVLIRDTQQRLKTTAVVVTHDMKSAFYIADRIGMLHNGRMHFLGTPEEISKTDDEVVKQFIEGSIEGPLTDD